MSKTYPLLLFPIGKIFAPQLFFWQEFSIDGSFDIQASLTDADFGLGGNIVTANIFISGPTKPGISYKEFNQKAYTAENKVGYIHMIPCELYHMVPKVQGDEDRITVGVTVHSYQTIQRDMLNQLA